MCSCCNYDSTHNLETYVTDVVKNHMAKNKKAYSRLTGIITKKITTKASLKNGEGIIGYNYLHGTNSKVGGLEIYLVITKHRNVFGVNYFNIVISCIWNDKIDPNFKYSSDIYKASIAEKIPFCKPKNYVLQIKWTQKLNLKV